MTCLAIIVHDTERVAEVCTYFHKNNLISIAHATQAAPHTAQPAIMMPISSKANCNMCEIWICWDWWFCRRGGGCQCCCRLTWQHLCFLKHPETCWSKQSAISRSQCGYKRQRYWHASRQQLLQLWHYNIYFFLSNIWCMLQSGRLGKIWTLHQGSCCTVSWSW